MSGEQGLYGKYTVLKDGQRQRNCFVLKPRSDPAARAALEAYADATDDEALEEDIRDWLKEERAWQEGHVDGIELGHVCTGCGKHVTGTYPYGPCADCGGHWVAATPDNIACDRCGEQDASRVFNSEHNRLCDDCIEWENRDEDGDSA